ncbi:MAG TPA: hypothetical protein VN193_16640 [Candidatus Angelobacter sp.]|jgi:hypothetical protein|nr:hypothetical protein [Candidatus Angelobacter sp.]
MNRAALIAWIVTALLVVAVVVAVAARPTHWERTAGLAAVLAVVAAVLALRYSRRPAGA